MKLVENNRVLNLTMDEVNVICLVLSPPFGDIQKSSDDPRLTRAYLKEMIQFLRQNSSVSEIVVKDGFLKDICLAFKVCCDIIDPLEMHTVTGYTWVEAMEVYDKLFVKAFAGIQKK